MPDDKENYRAAQSEHAQKLRAERAVMDMTGASRSQIRAALTTFAQRQLAARLFTTPAEPTPKPEPLPTLSAPEQKFEPRPFVLAPESGRRLPEVPVKAGPSTGVTPVLTSYSDSGTTYTLAALETVILTWTPAIAPAGWVVGSDAQTHDKEIIFNRILASGGDFFLYLYNADPVTSHDFDSANFTIYMLNIV